MCFDFMSCFFAEPRAYLPIKKFEIEKKDPDPKKIANYYCDITLDDNTKKKVILNSLKITTLVDALKPKVKESIIFPLYFYHSKTKSRHSPEVLFQKILNNKCNQPTNFIDQTSEWWNSLKN